jgi:fibronectin type 3 domain-containing protein
MCYRVFKSNNLKEEFIEITPAVLRDSSFVDLVNTRVLDRKIYYKVIAVDNNFNTSEYSQDLALARPDIISPVPPVFKRAEMKDGKLILEWDNSLSDDVAKLQLIRIEKEDRVSRLIISWGPSAIDSTYTEQALTLGKTYQYKLAVTDSAGNSSEVLSQEVLFETGIRPAVTGIQANVDRDKKLITLNWKNGSPAIKCLIYRKKNDGAMMLYKTLEGNIESFVDNALSINSIYSYQVQLVFVKGVKSTLSGEVRINY